MQMKFPGQSIRQFKANCSQKNYYVFGITLVRETHMHGIFVTFLFIIAEK